MHSTLANNQRIPTLEENLLYTNAVNIKSLLGSGPIIHMRKFEQVKKIASLPRKADRDLKMKSIFSIIMYDQNYGYKTSTKAKFLYMRRQKTITYNNKEKCSKSTVLADLRLTTLLCYYILRLWLVLPLRRVIIWMSQLHLNPNQKESILTSPDCAPFQA